MSKYNMPLLKEVRTRLALQLESERVLRAAFRKIPSGFLPDADRHEGIRLASNRIVALEWAIAEKDPK